MSNGAYNGWTKRERMATLRLQRDAVRAGTLAPPERCSICGFVDADDPTGANRCQFHDEVYSVVAPYVVCGRCHVTLHRRFERPQPWLRLVNAHATPGCWFENLTLDPESRVRPFAETYPELFGLNR